MANLCGNCGSLCSVGHKCSKRKTYRRIVGRTITPKYKTVFVRGNNYDLNPITIVRTQKSSSRTMYQIVDSGNTVSPHGVKVLISPYYLKRFWNV